ncbi:OvmZ protein [Streptomyces sp. NPDC050560]|uniref:OvmZ protein n=1 Tax=Streptomyces sp. NPDC050560 TaxID=3365630 RepID=UPI00379F7B65
MQALLDELPALYDACGHALAGPGDRRVKERITGTRNIGIALRQAILDVRDATLQVLASWADLVVQERATDDRPARNVPALAEFLSHHLPWLAEHPAADSLLDELDALTADAHRVIDTPEPADTVLGPCVIPGCDGTIIAPATPDTGTGPPAPRVHCDAGHTWSPQQWLLLSRRIQPGNSPRTTGD